MRDALRSVAPDERGLTTLEKIGILAIVITLLTFIPAVRGVIGDAYDAVFKQVDETTGEVSAFSIAARGILISVVAIAAFIGSGYLILTTNLGRRLAFLITGAAAFGWLAINSLLFVIYAPRGLRPATLEGLNAFQMRIPAIALTLASFIMFLIFVVALDRYERDEVSSEP